MTSTKDDGSGGVQIVFRNIVRWLEKSGCAVHLVYPARVSRLRVSGGNNGWGRPSIYCPLPTLSGRRTLVSSLVFLAYLPVAVFHLARLMRRARIDVVSCHFLAPYFLYLVVAARLRRTPVVISVHGADIDRFTGASWTQRAVCRAIMSSAHAIVACSAALARETILAFPGAGHKVTFVHNGLDESEYAPSTTRPEFERPFILSVCRHVSKKGIDTLLRAYALVIRQHPDVDLIVVGDGPLLRQHQELARDVGIAEHVVFAGDVGHGDVAAFFESCTMFVLPSRAEPFGVVLLEAALYRKGIVATHVGGVPEILTHGIDGWLVPPDEPAVLADAMLRLLRDPVLSTRMGNRAHQTLRSRFLWEQRIVDYTDLFEQAV